MTSNPSTVGCRAPAGRSPASCRTIIPDGHPLTTVSVQVGDGHHELHFALRAPMDRGAGGPANHNRSCGPVRPLALAADLAPDSAPQSTPDRTAAAPGSLQCQGVWPSEALDRPLRRRSGRGVTGQASEGLGWAGSTSDVSSQRPSKTAACRSCRRCCCHHRARAEPCDESASQSCRP